MFVNQVNIKDLFSTNPSLMGRHDQSSDSAFSSSQGNSQLMLSQVDFSESQDLISVSTLPSQSTKAESKTSPGKKFYQRYMSKGLLFPKDNQSAESVKSKLSFKEQLAVNKAAAKERDDREIISSIFSVIRESTFELKEAISVVQENLQANSSSKHDLKDHIAKVEKKLSEHTVKFLDNLTTRDQLKDEIGQLKQQLAQKETELAKTREQLKETKSNQLKGLKDQLQKMHEDHQVWLLDHFENITSQQKQMHNNAHTKQQKLSDQQTKTIKKIETILQKHVDSYTKQQKSEHSKYQQWLNDLKETQEQQAASIKDSLTSTLEDAKSSQKGDMTALILQQDQLRNLYQQHRTDMEKYLTEQLQATKDGNAEIKELVDHICRETLPAVLGRQDKQNNDFIRNSSYSTNVLVKPFNDSSQTVTQCQNDPVGRYPARAQKVNIAFTERTAHPKDGFCSPLTPYVKTWNTKTLFSKRNQEENQEHPNITSRSTSHDSGISASRGTRQDSHPDSVHTYQGVFGKVLIRDIKVVTQY